VEETIRKWQQQQMQEVDKKTAIKEEEKKQKIPAIDIIQLKKLLKV
jgi:hypothetical protein